MAVVLHGKAFGQRFSVVLLNGRGVRGTVGRPRLHRLRVDHTGGKSPLLDHRTKLGRFGECVARCYLRCRGYRILARNFKTPYAEIDILGRRRNELVLVEVKTRRSPREEPRISYRQERRLLRAAAWVYGRWGHPQGGIRIDLVTVTMPRRGFSWPRVRHYLGAIEDDVDRSRWPH